MIYLAKVSVEINRAGRKHPKVEKWDYFKENKEVEMVYSEGAEKLGNSYFISCLDRELSIRYDKKESYKIKTITKIKPLGLVDNE